MQAVDVGNSLCVTFRCNWCLAGKDKIFGGSTGGVVAYVRCSFKLLYGGGTLSSKPNGNSGGKRDSNTCILKNSFFRVVLSGNMSFLLFLGIMLPFLVWCNSRDVNVFGVVGCRVDIVESLYLIKCGVLTKCQFLYKI